MLEHGFAVQKGAAAFARTAPCKLVSGAGHAVERCQYLPKADLRDKPVELTGGEPAAVKQPSGFARLFHRPASRHSFAARDRM